MSTDDEAKAAIAALDGFNFKGSRINVEVFLLKTETFFIE